MRESWKLEIRHLIWTILEAWYVSLVIVKEKICKKYKKECEKDIPDQYSLFYLVQIFISVVIKFEFNW